LLNPSRLREAELALINAPFEEGGWQSAVERAAWACGGSAANLVGLGGPMLLPFNLFTGKHAGDAGRHFANPTLWGSCNWRVGSSGAPMTIQHEDHYRAYRRTHGAGLTADYDDIVSDMDMQYGCQAVLMADQEHFLGLAVMRGRMEGRCDGSALFAFSQVIRHAQRAVRVHLALDGEAGELLVSDWADRASPMLVLDRFGGLCAMTPEGEALLDEGGPLSLRGISIAARNRREDRGLQGALARLLRIRDDAVGPHLHQMVVGRSEAHAHGRWRLSLLRLPRRPHGLGFDPHLLICAKPIGELFQRS
jgi:hypothetical protein